MQQLQQHQDEAHPQEPQRWVAPPSQLHPWTNRVWRPGRVVFYEPSLFPETGLAQQLHLAWTSQTKLV